MNGRQVIIEHPINKYLIKYILIIQDRSAKANYFFKNAVTTFALQNK